MFAILIHSMAVGYCGASARIKFDDEQFAALFNELQSRGDRAKLMRIVFLEAHKKKSALLLSRRFIYSNVAWATFCSPILI